MNDKQAHSLAVAMTKAIMGKDYISTIDNKGRELLPCPFCCSEAKVIAKNIILDESFFSVKCTNLNCQCSLAWFLTREEAINAWNYRGIDPDPVNEES